MRTDTVFLTRTALFLALTLALQALRLPVFMTGPLVNFLLAAATFWNGPASGAIIGLLTPAAALFFGILPPPLAPAIPFIMAGNACFALAIGFIFRRLPTPAGKVAGAIAGATAKFLIIAGAASHVLTLPGPLTGVLLFPQLYNALLGGLAATLLKFPVNRRQ